LKANYYILFLLFFFFTKSFLFAQKNEVDPNGYNKFYYGNKQISSEGMMKDGKPEGYWKTYYTNGKMKSEGNRRSFLLDSTWVFYDENGDTLEKISFLYGKKNGYYYKYNYTKNDKGEKIGGLASKELYVNDKQEGLSYYYYDDGKLFQLFNYSEGKKSGIGKEFSKDSVLISVYEFHNGYQINVERINRRDKNGLKQNMWKTFYLSDKVKTAGSYKDGKLNGYYREYDERGKIYREEKYIDGILSLEKDTIVDSTKIVVDFKDDFYANGKLKKSGGFIFDSIPVGIHREYDTLGKITAAKLYDEKGVLLGTGMVDESGRKQGKWYFYNNIGSKESEGNYKNDYKYGKWIFYYRDGSIEQKGSYSKDKINGLWQWYYQNGKLRCEENYIDGKLDGMFTAFNEDERIITIGKYTEGEKDSTWYYHIGDNFESGNYDADQMEGTWKFYYADSTLSFEGKFVQGNEDGKHRYYFPNGRMKEEQVYINGMKHGAWRKFDELGNLFIVINYRDNQERKINGKRLNLPEE